MNAEHTPGPWFVSVHDDNNETVVRCRENQGYEPIICNCEYDNIDIVTVEELAANARLIAAAPNLLAACKDLVRRAETMTDGEWGEPEEIAQAKAAIAQAEKGE